MTAENAAATATGPASLTAGLSVRGVAPGTRSGRGPPVFAENQPNCLKLASDNSKPNLAVSRASLWPFGDAKE